MGEQPEQCLAREVREELSLDIQVGEILAAWLFEVISGRHVFVVAYRCSERSEDVTPRLTNEHIDVGWFKTSELDRIRLPQGYAHAVRLAAMPPG